MKKQEAIDIVARCKVMDLEASYKQDFFFDRLSINNFMTHKDISHHVSDWVVTIGQFKFRKYFSAKKWIEMKRGKFVLKDRLNKICQ